MPAQRSAEPLSPPPRLRPLLVYLPPVVLTIAAWYWRRASSLRQRLLAAATAALFSLGATGWVAAGWPLAVLPTEEELAVEGGRYFTRPSDGKRIEYYTAGAPSSRTVVILNTRACGKMFREWQRPEVEQVLKTKGATLVCPAIPSVSASDPYEYTCAEDWLRWHTGDMIALLDSLGAEEVYVLGVSWAAQTAVSLAEALLPSGRLRGVATLVGVMFNTRDVTYNAVSGSASLWMRALVALFANPVIVRPMVYFIFRPMLASTTAAALEKRMPPADVKELKDAFGGDLAPFADGSVRSMRWFLHQCWHVTDTAYEAKVKQYVDYSAFPAHIPVHLHHGSRDINVPFSAQEAVQNRIPHAEFRRFEGSHTGFSVPAAVKGLFDAQPTQ